MLFLTILDTFLLISFIYLIFIQSFQYISSNFYKTYLRPLLNEDARLAEFEQVDESTPSTNSNEQIITNKNTDKYISFQDFHDEHFTRLDLPGIQPEEGDIIIFKHNDNVTHSFDGVKDINNNDKLRRVSRAISTYGEEPVPCNDTYTNLETGKNEPQKYVVLGIDSYIPNCKINPCRKFDEEVIDKETTTETDFINEIGLTNDIHLHVYPIKDNDLESFSFDDINIMDIFWYINYSRFSICQYEDGASTVDLEFIKIIKRRFLDDMSICQDSLSSSRNSFHEDFDLNDEISGDEGNNHVSSGDDGDNHATSGGEVDSCNESESNENEINWKPQYLDEIYDMPDEQDSSIVYTSDFTGGDSNYNDGDW